LIEDDNDRIGKKLPKRKMLTMQGRYNTANIMIDEIDETTRAQIQGFLDHPAFEGGYIAIMPDCHAGKGAVIGFTMKLNRYVIPNVIGVDIGCGMLMAKYPVDEIRLPALDALIKRTIPSGFSINDTMNAERELVSEVTEVCGMIGIDAGKALRAIGSLGGGNHFIEAGFDGGRRLALTVHSGSRNFGKCVADFYQGRARAALEKEGSRGHYRELEFMPVESADARDYFYALGVAQRFASANRREMVRRLSAFLRREPIDIIESVHNFIGDDDIVRKGATPARRGERVIIPFNMADGIAVCVGKGSARYNNSAPHGAGRILSRTQAKKNLSLQDFTTMMKKEGVYTTTATRDTLDEAPGAYKPKEVILANIAETVEIIEFIKPVYNFKAGND
jgi:RNA-splicing ligase RtcB